MEVYEEHHDLEQVRGLLGHKSIETTQLYAQIRPAGLKHAVDFFEAKALDALSSEGGNFEDGGPVFECRQRHDSNTRPSNINKNNLVAPTGFEPVFGRGHVFAIVLDRLQTLGP